MPESCEIEWLVKSSMESFQRISSISDSQNRNESNSTICLLTFQTSTHSRFESNLQYFSFWYKFLLHSGCSLKPESSASVCHWIPSTASTQIYALHYLHISFYVARHFRETGSGKYEVRQNARNERTLNQRQSAHMWPPARKRLNAIVTDRIRNLNETLALAES